MATYGRIKEFDENQEDWNQYVDRMGHYFTANEITDKEKQRAIFLSVCGSKVYKLICDLLVPAKPDTKSIDELTNLVKNHVQPKPSEIVQRYKFHSCFRTKGQSIADFIAHIRHLSADCNFGDTLDLMLRDRLVCGVNDDKIQRRLLAEAELTFAKAETTAKLMEQASKNVVDLQRNEVNVVKTASNKPTHKPDTKRELRECWRCGGKSHLASDCFYKDAECHNCHGKGHLIKKCPKPKQAQAKPKPKEQFKGGYQKKKGAKQKFLQENEADSDDEYPFYSLGEAKGKPIMATLEINGVKIPMEVDTGASKTVVSEETAQKVKSDMTATHVKLRTYTGEAIPIIGESELEVRYKEGASMNLKAIVVKGNGPNLIGRDWLTEIKLDWDELFYTIGQEIPGTAFEDSEVFDGKLGKYRGAKAKIHVQENATPKYFKARPVPFALKAKIGAELDRMEKDGTIEKVQYSEWAAPIVPVVKSDSSIRICGDYKITVNAVSTIDSYPIPKTEDLFADLKGKYFSKLDMSNAYQQIELEEESKKYTTINTHKGLYRYNRLCFGISSSPGIFQRIMDNILQGMEGVRVRVDDILIAGRSVTEHNQILKEVLARLEAAGLKLKKSKCIFMACEVVYLGHKLSEDGVEALQDKITAIEDMERPTNKKELQSYLGLINYYARFLPNVSTVLTPLYQLLKKNEQFEWGHEQEKAWSTSKEMLVQSEVLVHFDQSREMILTCDASPYGVGAVLSHKMDDGSERPIAFASRTLTCSEKNYSQIEKEGLAVIFGVKKFHQYLYASKPFQIVTDHKPLLGLFKEAKGTSVMASARIQRWSLLLGAYNYTLKHRPGACIGHADGLSRFPRKVDTPEPPIPGETILLMEQLETMPVTAKQISRWTASDTLLSKIKYYVLNGWPPKANDEQLRPYASRKCEISVVDGCLLWGSRVIVPPKGREVLLEELHEGHSGMTKMKSIARSYVWWPNIDRDIEMCVKKCDACQINNRDPCRAPLHPWEWPGKPWSRLHIDYAGPFMGKMFLIIIDAYSKWMDVYPTSTATTTATVELLRQSFAVHGLPDIIVSDNGTCFTSAEFQEYVSRNGIRHITSAPYHPATNGLAERAVQTFKTSMKKQKDGSIQTKVSRFLFEYRTTAHSTTGQAPAELMFQRKPKTRLDLVTPNLHAKVEQKQFNQQRNHSGKPRNGFAEGDAVYVKNYGVRGEKWLKGHVVDKSGPISYRVRVDGNEILKRHVNQMKPCSSELENICFPAGEEVIDQEIIIDQEIGPLEHSGSNAGVAIDHEISQSEGSKDRNSDTCTTESIPEPRRSVRQKQMPAMYKYFVMG